MYKAIDIHCHLNHNVQFDAAENEYYHCDLDFLKREHLRLNIPLCAMAGTFACVQSYKSVEEENKYLFKLSQEDPFVYQWVVIDPRNENTFRQAEYMLKSRKSLGIKIHAESHGYSLNQYGTKLFSFANDHGAVILSHLAIDYDFKDVDDFPDMSLIIAHLGAWCGYYIPIIKRAKHQNIYTDTSGSASHFNDVIETTVRQVGSEKILFGTDTYSCAFQRGRIDYADISEKDKENILYKNALRLFPKLKDDFYKE